MKKEKLTLEEKENLFFLLRLNNEDKKSDTYISTELIKKLLKICEVKLEHRDCCNCGSYYEEWEFIPDINHCSNCMNDVNDIAGFR